MLKHSFHICFSILTWVIILSTSAYLIAAPCKDGSAQNTHLKGHPLMLLEKIVLHLLSLYDAKGEMPLSYYICLHRQTNNLGPQLNLNYLHD